uniref:TPX2 C-terminal domain-containing protein n=1 Tax=Cajanus cajan TaxID=3821 RepID=A0A151U945_CAJCA|nr:hypothetical protein KK1_019921 [Cajanus cajan]
MAESSACLVRSFSTPADTCYEGNPIRALGESISFGRFMSEELDWEKWSTFTHNRYVEEAEKYSKPGSVAAKKAYFEARYKRKAAERAAAWVQEANALANGTTESSIDTKDSRHPRIDIYLNVESCTLDDDSNSSQFHHVEDKKNIVVPVEVLALSVKGREANSSPELSTETVSQENSPSLDERKDAAAVPTPQSGINNGSKGKKSVSGDSVEKKNLTARSTRETRKRVAVALQSRNGLNNFSTTTKPSAKSMKSVGHSVEKRPTTRSLHMSISLPSGAGETSKTASMLEQNRVKRLHSNFPKTKVLLTYPLFICCYIYISGFPEEIQLKWYSCL